MTRPSGKSRVAAQEAQGEISERRQQVGSSSLPPMRKRRPLMYWTVVIATAAMVLATFASLISALG